MVRPLTDSTRLLKDSSSCLTSSFSDEDIVASWIPRIKVAVELEMAAGRAGTSIQKEI